MLNKPSLFSKAVAWGVTFVFLVSTPAQSVPIPFASFVVTSPPYLAIPQMQLAPEMGRIDEVFNAPSPKTSGFVWLIQDAHDSLDAQENIRKILNQLAQQAKVSLVCFEGGASQLDKKFYDFTPNIQLNQKVWDALFREGEISGLERAALEAPESMRFYGIEEEKTYFKNIHALQKLFSLEDNSQEEIKRIDSGFAKQRGTLLNGEIKKFDSARNAFNENKIPLSHYAKLLARQAKRAAGLDLENAATQAQWPMLVRLVKSLKLEKRVQPPHPNPLPSAKGGPASGGQESLGEGKGSVFSPLPPGGRGTKGEGGPLPGHLRWYFERWYDSLDPESKQLSPAVKEWIGYQILKDEIHPQELLAEIHKLENLLIAHIPVSEETKRFLADERRWASIKKLIHFKLTKEEWQEFCHSDPERSEGEESRLNDDETFGGAKTNFATGNVDSSPAFGGLRMTRKLITLAEQNYRLVIQRDVILTRNTEARIRQFPAKQIAVVTGGFHSDSITAALRKKEISYAVISPTIRDTGRKLNYRKQIDPNTSKLTAPVDGAFESPVARPFQNDLLQKAAEFLTAIEFENGGTREAGTVQPSDNEARSLGEDDDEDESEREEEGKWTGASIIKYELEGWEDIFEAVLNNFIRNGVHSETFGILLEVIPARPDLAETIFNAISNYSENLSADEPILTALVEASPDLCIKVLRLLYKNCSEIKPDSIRAIKEAIKKEKFMAGEEWLAVLQEVTDSTTTINNGPLIGDQWIGIAIFDITIEEFPEHIPGLSEWLDDNRGTNFHDMDLVLNRLGRIFDLRPDLAAEMVPSLSSLVVAGDGELREQAFNFLLEIFETKPDVIEKVIEHFSYALSREAVSEEEEMLSSVVPRLIKLRPDLAHNFFDPVHQFVAFPDDPEDDIPLRKVEASLQVMRQLVALRKDLAERAMHDALPWLSAEYKEPKAAALDVMLEVMEQEPALAVRALEPAIPFLWNQDEYIRAAIREPLLARLSEHPEWAALILDHFRPGAIPISERLEVFSAVAQLELDESTSEAVAEALLPVHGGYGQESTKSILLLKKLIARRQGEESGKSLVRVLMAEMKKYFSRPRLKPHDVQTAADWISVLANITPDFHDKELAREAVIQVMEISQRGLIPEGTEFGTALARVYPRFLEDEVLLEKIMTTEDMMEELAPAFSDQKTFPISVTRELAGKVMVYLDHKESAVRLRAAHLLGALSDVDSEHQVFNLGLLRDLAERMNDRKEEFRDTAIWKKFGTIFEELLAARADHKSILERVLHTLMRMAGAPAMLIGILLAELHKEKELEKARRKENNSKLVHETDRLLELATERGLFQPMQFAPILEDGALGNLLAMELTELQMREYLDRIEKVRKLAERARAALSPEELLFAADTLWLDGEEKKIYLDGIDKELGEQHLAASPSREAYQALRIRLEMFVADPENPGQELDAQQKLKQESLKKGYGLEKDQPVMDRTVRLISLAGDDRFYGEDDSTREIILETVRTRKANPADWVGYLDRWNLIQQSGILESGVFTNGLALERFLVEAKNEIELRSKINNLKIALDAALVEDKEISAAEAFAYANRIKDFPPDRHGRLQKLRRIFKKEKAGMMETVRNGLAASVNKVFGIFAKARHVVSEPQPANAVPVQKMPEALDPVIRDQVEEAFFASWVDLGEQVHELWGERFIGIKEHRRQYYLVYSFVDPETEAGEYIFLDFRAELADLKPVNLITDPAKLEALLPQLTSEREGAESGDAGSPPSSPGIAPTSAIGTATAVESQVPADKEIKVSEQPTRAKQKRTKKRDRRVGEVPGAPTSGPEQTREEPPTDEAPGTVVAESLGKKEAKKLFEEVIGRFHEIRWDSLPQQTRDIFEKDLKSHADFGLNKDFAEMLRSSAASLDSFGRRGSQPQFEYLFRQALPNLRNLLGNLEPYWEGLVCYFSYDSQWSNKQAEQMVAWLKEIFGEDLKRYWPEIIRESETGQGMHALRWGIFKLMEYKDYIHSIEDFKLFAANFRKGGRLLNVSPQVLIDLFGAKLPTFLPSCAEIMTFDDYANHSIFFTITKLKKILGEQFYITWPLLVRLIQFSGARANGNLEYLRILLWDIKDAGKDPQRLLQLVDLILQINPQPSPSFLEGLYQAMHRISQADFEKDYFTEDLQKKYAWMIAPQIISFDLSKAETDQILEFISETGDFNPDFYSYYLKQPDVALKRVRGFTDLVLSDDMTEEGIRRFKSSLDQMGLNGLAITVAAIQMAIPSSRSGCAGQEEAQNILGQFLEEGSISNPFRDREKSSLWDIDLDFAEEFGNNPDPSASLAKNLRFKVVKGIAHGLSYQLTGESSLSKDIWYSGDFFWLAVIDKSKKKVIGYLKLLERYHEGRKTLIAFDLDPQDEALKEIPVESFWYVVKKALKRIADKKQFSLLFFPGPGRGLFGGHALSNNMKMKRFLEMELTQREYERINRAPIQPLANGTYRHLPNVILMIEEFVSIPIDGASLGAKLSKLENGIPARYGNSPEAVKITFEAAEQVASLDFRDYFPDVYRQFMTDIQEGVFTEGPAILEDAPSLLAGRLRRFTTHQRLEQSLYLMA
ncbi:MAG: hypothetical protein HY586_00120 [Candidatus Omnitrophica bacterium]|nr:hypothetical protein [Candidatus Omnitrophota bacterium]